MPKRLRPWKARRTVPRTKPLRRPRPDAARVFHPDAEQLLRALAVAFGLALVTPPPPSPPERAAALSVSAGKGVHDDTR